MVSRLGRIARGLVATVGVAVIVVGLPAGLLASGAPRVLDRGEISGWLAGNDQFPTHSLWAVVFWFGMAAWLIATSAIVLEAVGYAFRRRSSRLPGLGGLHVVAEWLVRSVAGMVMMSATLRSVPGAVASPLPAAAMVAAHPADLGAVLSAPPRTAGAEARVVTLSAAATVHRSAATGQRHLVAAATLASAPPTVVLPPIPGRTIPAGAKVYVVEYHRPTPDTLWRIAAEHLGDPLRFHEIVALNVGQMQPDGRRLAPDGHWIYAQWVLELPPDAVGVPVVADAPSLASIIRYQGSVTNSRA